MPSFIVLRQWTRPSTLLPALLLCAACHDSKNAEKSSEGETPIAVTPAPTASVIPAGSMFSLVSQEDICPQQMKTGSTFSGHEKTLPGSPRLFPEGTVIVLEAREKVGMSKSVLPRIPYRIWATEVIYTEGLTTKISGEVMNIEDAPILVTRKRNSGIAKITNKVLGTAADTSHERVAIQRRVHGQCYSPGSRIAVQLSDTLRLDQKVQKQQASPKSRADSGSKTKPGTTRRK